MICGWRGAWLDSQVLGRHGTACSRSSVVGQVQACHILIELPSMEGLGWCWCFWDQWCHGDCGFPGTQGARGPGRPVVKCRLLLWSSQIFKLPSLPLLQPPLCLLWCHVSTDPPKQQYFPDGRGILLSVPPLSKVCRTVTFLRATWSFHPYEPSHICWNEWVGASLVPQYH